MAIWTCPECDIAFHPSHFPRSRGRVPGHWPPDMPDPPKCPLFSDCHECRRCDGLDPCPGSFKVPMLDTTRDLEDT